MEFGYVFIAAAGAHPVVQVRTNTLCLSLIQEWIRFSRLLVTARNPPWHLIALSATPGTTPHDGSWIEIYPELRATQRLHRHLVTCIVSFRKFREKVDQHQVDSMSARCSPCAISHRYPLLLPVLRPPPLSLCLSRLNPRLGQCTANARMVSSGQSHDVVDFRSKSLTLLHRITSFLPRVLPSKNTLPSINAVDSFEFWDALLSHAYHRLSTPSAQPVRIVVYSLDRWSGAQDIVTALLEQPLSSDPSQNKSVRNRWKSSSENRLTICHESHPPSTPSALPVQSPYLLQFGPAVELTEIVLPSDSRRTHSHDFCETTLAALHNADIPIVVCNPLTSPISALAGLLPLNNPNTILVLTSSVPYPPTHHNFIFAVVSPGKLLDDLKIVLVDPARAAVALEILEADPGSSTAIQRYQDNFVARHTLSQLRGALDACQIALARAKEDILLVSRDINHLSDRIEEEHVKAPRSVFGGAGGSMSDSDAVQDALETAGKDMRVVLNRLAWWRMVWHVDEISGIISEAIHRSWCKALEKELILQTGRLSTLQAELTHSALSLLSAPRSPSFDSPILHNNLLQLSSSPTYPLSSSSLIRPLTARRDQLLRYPTTRLHVSGQRAVLGMGGSIAAGTGLSWVGWLGWLSSGGEGLMGVIGMDAMTAMGAGILGALVGIRWSVGKWEKSKKKWWDDWARVSAGMSRDLTQTLEQVMRQHVLIVSDRACSGLSDLAEKRKLEIEAIEEDLDKLLREFEKIEKRP
ncbi:hypothetical protein BD779DRAFT_1505224 [Infundibulicybe gibba]|nr:hypothetical protein BD779DRAFT_1505224 [Infundibulicybe gibba]